MTIEQRVESAYWPAPLWERRMDFYTGPLPGEPVNATFENVGGARLHYVDAGSGPAVVLLHGFASSLEVWKHVVPQLSHRNRVLAVDLKGFGWSDRPQGDYSPRSHAQLIWALLHGRGIEQAALVGHSWGASVALAMALAAPERTSRIALYDAWVYEAQLSFLFRWWRAAGIGEALFRFYDHSWLDHQVALGFHDPGHLTPRFVYTAKQRMDRPGARAAALATLRGMNFTMQQMRYTGLRKPALVLWGEKDSISAPAFGRQLAADLGGELVVFPRCGHFPMIEAHEASNATLRSFLETPNASSGQSNR